MKQVQLPLGVSFNAYATFDNFLPGCNRLALEAVQNSLDAARPASVPAEFGFVYLWGRANTGKSHLLQAACQQVSAREAPAAFVPLEQVCNESPRLLDGFGSLDLVCLDNLERISGDPDWERALFNLFNQLRDNNRCLLISAGCNINELGLQLPDLLSRMHWGLNFRLQSLSDQQKKEALALRCACRGIELPTETISYLLNHSFRDLGSLSSAVDRLVDAAIEQRRQLTIPFAKQVLKL